MADSQSTTSGEEKPQRKRSGQFSALRVPEYVPTLEQIAEAAAIERQSWSAADYQLRAGRAARPSHRRSSDVRTAADAARVGLLTVPVCRVARRASR